MCRESAVMSDVLRWDGDPEGRYANYFQIGFNADEFVFDFGQQYPPDPERIHTRIIASPSSARTFSALLTDTLRQFDEGHKKCEVADE